MRDAAYVPWGVYILCAVGARILDGTRLMQHDLAF